MANSLNFIISLFPLRHTLSFSLSPSTQGLFGFVHLISPLSIEAMSAAVAPAASTLRTMSSSPMDSKKTEKEGSCHAQSTRSFFFFTSTFASYYYAVIFLYVLSCLSSCWSYYTSDPYSGNTPLPSIHHSFAVAMTSPSGVIDFFTSPPQHLGTS